jgi:hypothetical protein
MPRLLKLSGLTFLVLIGAWLVISGVYSLCASRIGGMYVFDLEDGCFFIPDIGGWLGRFWYAGITSFGLFLGWRSAKALFATMRLSRSCDCSSGRAYRYCCFRRERAFLFVGVLATVVLFSFRAMDGSLGPTIGIVVSAALALWLVGHHYRRRPTVNRRAARRI